MTKATEGRRPIPARRLRVVRGISAAMVKRGIRPNEVSLLGLAAGLGSGLLLALTSVYPGMAPALWITSALLVLIRGLSNMLDGMLAVEHGMAGPTGLFYNELPDRISDVALLVGAGYSIGGSATAGWLAACLALFVTYVRTIGSLAGAPADFKGPFAKQQRMFSVAFVCCLLAAIPNDWQMFWGPDGGWGPMAAWLWILCLGTALTAILRIHRAVAHVTRTTSSE